MTAPQRRGGVDFLKGQGFSEREACALIGLARSSYQYETRPTEDSGLGERIRQLAYAHPRFGYRRVWALLRRAGEVVNFKRVHRLWQQLKLQRPRRKRRKRYQGQGTVPCQATHPNHVWSYDFLYDRCANGRVLKLLPVGDEYTRCGLALKAESRMPSGKVIEVLDGLVKEHGAPEFIRSDNGPEFVARAIKRWLAARGMKTIYIEPGSPWQNGYAESFNGRFRDECLNAEVFNNVAEAQVTVGTWLKMYNEERPHSSLGYLTPAEFKAGVTKVGALPPHPRSLTLCGPNMEAQKNGRGEPRPHVRSPAAALGSLSSVALSSAQALAGVT